MHAAVFVDFENLFLSLKGRNELSGQRTRELCISILERLKERLQVDKVPMVLGRSYAVRGSRCRARACADRSARCGP